MNGGEMSSGNRPPRKTIEKNRRTEMKTLCLKLVSLIPNEHFALPKEFLAQQDQIEEATSYIKTLRQRVEELKRRKSQAQRSFHSKLPILNVRDLGSDLEVVLITGLLKNFKLHEIIDIIEQGGAQVVSVYISTIGDKTFHTFRGEAKLSRIGVDASRICERIQELIS